MLHRLQSSARRHPRLCLALVLVAFSSQSMAVALDWCLDAVGGVHVTSVFAPCDERHDPAGSAAIDPAAQAASGSGASALQATLALPHCHDGAHHGAPGHPMHHVAASSDAAPSLAATIAALPVAACWQFVPHARLETSGAATAGPCRAATALATPCPRLSGAIPGESCRLLI